MKTKVMYLIVTCGVAVMVSVATVKTQMMLNTPATPTHHTDTDAFVGLQPGLGTLPLLGRGRTRSITAENPTGEKGKGGMAIPNPSAPKRPDSAWAADQLGQGWKVRPFLRMDAGETVVLMDVVGSGIIQHIWLVEMINPGLVIRFYWDGEDTPSVESPVPDFFAVGHGRFAPVNSLPVVNNHLNALNCFWPMPFRTRVRITLTNETNSEIGLVAYQITYVETEVPANAGTFHAQYRQATTGDQNPYIILDKVSGKGRYVGTFLAWTQMEKGWFGEGEIKFYMDGDGKFSTICGTGTEDYFLWSFGFPRSFTNTYSGSLLPANSEAEPPSYWSLYRWHIQDPINFEEDLRVTIQALGFRAKGYKKLKYDKISSVAYWYQTEPHSPFPQFPTLVERALHKRAVPQTPVTQNHSAMGKKITFINNPTKAAERLLAYYLVDGRVSDVSKLVCDQPEWLGFHNIDFDAVIDLGEVMPINDVAIEFLQQDSAGVYTPANLEVMVSDDNKIFKTVINEKVVPGPDALQKNLFSKDGLNAKGRYVKIIAKNKPGVWIFIDEIMINPK